MGETEETEREWSNVKRDRPWKTGFPEGSRCER